MTIILLTFFLWQCWNCVISDENRQAEFYSELWTELSKDFGIKLD